MNVNPQATTATQKVAIAKAATPSDDGIVKNYAIKHRGPNSTATKVRRMQATSADKAWAQFIAMPGKANRVRISITLIDAKPRSRLAANQQATFANPKVEVAAQKVASDARTAKKAAKLAAKNAAPAVAAVVKAPKTANASA